jgi:hypothetical protein
MSDVIFLQDKEEMRNKEKLHSVQAFQVYSIYSSESKCQCHYQADGNLNNALEQVL